MTYSHQCCIKINKTKEITLGVQVWIIHFLNFVLFAEALPCEQRPCDIERSKGHGSRGGKPRSPVQISVSILRSRALYHGIGPCESLTLLSMTSALSYITIVNLVCRGDGRPVVCTVYLGTHRSYSLSGDSKNHNQNVRDRRKGYAYHCICRAHC